MSNQTICRYFAATGNCFYGDQCNFLHVRPEQSGDFANYAKPKSQIPCRNVSLHGFCKFQGKGCEYNHDNIPPKKPEEQSVKKQGSNGEITNALQNLSISSQEYVPPQGYSTSYPNNSNFPLTNDQNFLKPRSSSLNDQNVMNKLVPPPVQLPPPPNHFPPLNATIPSVPSPYQPQSIPQPQPPPSRPVQHGGTVYFYGAEQPPAQVAPPPPPVTLQYNPTAGVLPHAIQGRRSIQSFFMSEDLRHEMKAKNDLIYAVSTQDHKHKELPRTVHHYHSLFTLDNPAKPSTTSVFGYHTSVYKCISSNDGFPYAIRRIEGFRVSNEQALKMGELWRQIQHPNIVTLSELFISKDFGEVNSLFFAYHYHPGSQTLEERFFIGHSNVELLPEGVLWSYASQLLSALRAIHSAGVACRVLIPSKILITGKNRLRINCCGIHDVVNFDGGKNVGYYQRDDIIALGRLILSLACRSIGALQNVSKSLDFVAQRYSPELKNFILYILAKTNATGVPSIDDLSAMVAPKLLTEMERLHSYNDSLESELYKELENGRLMRLLTKLGFINERPEFDMDPSWSETGDRYLLKLFRDYVFHQVYEDSTPVIDFAHVVECLNKLDAGVPEKIVLMSRDEQSILIVSYKDLKRCIEQAFSELARPAQRLYGNPPGMPQHPHY